jgi:hypothetical protein
MTRPSSVVACLILKSFVSDAVRLFGYSKRASRVFANLDSTAFCWVSIRSLLKHNDVVVFVGKEEVG